VVVNAAGPDAADVAGLADVALPVQQVKGELLVTERVPRCLDLVVGEVRQTRAGNFLLGVTWEPGKNDRRSTARHLTRLAEQAVRLLPRLARVRVIRSFAGIRPVPEDEVSLLGPVASRPGFYLAVTHSGVTLAPLMAEVLADFLEDRRHPAWDDRLSPDRFARANR